MGWGEVGDRIGGRRRGPCGKNTCCPSRIGKGREGGTQHDGCEGERVGEKSDGVKGAVRGRWAGDW